MKAIVLGSAAGGGFPQWNCGCNNCALAWAGDARAAWRTQSSLALIDGQAAVLVNASPDLGQQLRRTRELWPLGTRQSPIQSVVLTSAEIDHVAGLAMLRERHEFAIVALAPVHAAIRDNPLFAPLLARRLVASDGESFQATPNLELTLFAVPGKAPLYLEPDDVSGEAQGEVRPGASMDGEACGVLAVGRSATLAYVPGCAALTPELAEWVSRADIVLFDGTLHDDDEMKRAGLGEKTGRRMGHVPMTGPGGSLGWLAALPAVRKIYIHINNSNPVLIEGSPERLHVEGAGVEIGHDGLEIEL